MLKQGSLFRFTRLGGNLLFYTKTNRDVKERGRYMNRGPFLHGMVRFANVNCKNNRRRRRVTLARTIVNLIFFALGLAVIIAVIALGLGKIFLVGAAFFLGVAAVPLLMSTGKNMVMHETEIAINQKRAEMELDYNKKRVIIGYLLMFTPLYILMLASFFFPALDAWIVPYIPVFVYTLIAAVLTAHTVEALDLSIKKYKWIHISLFVLIAIAGFFIRACIMFPWLNNK